MGIHPYQLDKYTPREIEALFAYIDWKRTRMNDGV